MKGCSSRAISTQGDDGTGRHLLDHQMQIRHGPAVVNLEELPCGAAIEMEESEVGNDISRL